MKQVETTDKSLTKKQKISYLVIAILIGIGTFLSPVISPYLIGWIDFTGKGWEIAEYIVGVIAFLTLLGFGIWFAIDSVKSLKNTLSDVFGK